LLHATEKISICILGGRDIALGKTGTQRLLNVSELLRRGVWDAYEPRHGGRVRIAYRYQGESIATIFYLCPRRRRQEDCETQQKNTE